MCKIRGFVPRLGVCMVYIIFIDEFYGPRVHVMGVVATHVLNIFIWELGIEHLPAKQQNQLLLFKSLRSDHL